MIHMNRLQMLKGRHCKSINFILGLLTPRQKAETDLIPVLAEQILANPDEPIVKLPVRIFLCINILRLTHAGLGRLIISIGLMTD